MYIFNKSNTGPLWDERMETLPLFFFFKVMMGRFVEVCRRGLKIDVGKNNWNKVVVLGEEEGSVCEVL